jgi:uncharacterized protein
MTPDNAHQPEPVEPSADSRVTRPGGLSYLHIPAVDTRESAVFYERVFGWDVHGHETERPSFDDGTGHVSGAWMTDLAVSNEPGLLPYIYVSDIDDTTAKIEPNGGQIVEGPRPEGTLRVATFRDPAGNVMGVWHETRH